MTSSSDIALMKASWQQVLFAERLGRASLLGLQPEWQLQQFNVQVHRNQPFELVAMAMPAFLTYADLQIAFSFGDYDDSLAMASVDKAAQLHIVALDFSRYDSLSNEQLAHWVTERVRHLRTKTDMPILVTNADAIDGDIDFNNQLSSLLDQIPLTYVADVNALAKELAEDFWDERSAQIKASRWSNQAALQMARAFGLRWIPAAILPPIKALAVDLDNTLYDGVIGEDGVAGVTISAGHSALQQHLMHLIDAGVFVTLVSRNEARDVDALFASRPDFLLDRSKLAAVVANWGDKSANINEIAQRLHIGVDAIAFVDDNPGELAKVAGALPSVKTVHATQPEDTLRTLMMLPGLLQFATRKEDTLRVSDIIATQEREAALASADNTADYLASLDIHLQFQLDDLDGTGRMHELTHKTNQFNLSLARTNEATIERGLHDGTLHAVTVQLRDRLSDSGVIGLVLGRNDGEAVTVLELDVSCRALGRDLEDALVFKAIELIHGHPPKKVVFEREVGPRNAPALDWLRRWIPDDTNASLDWDDGVIKKAISATPATLTVSNS